MQTKNLKYLVLAAAVALAACTTPQPIPPSAQAANCSNDLVTGSHYVRRENCATAKESAEQDERNRELMYKLHSSQVAEPTR